jgi:uncharacterized repeat protein (TIGR03803 family)
MTDSRRLRRFHRAICLALCETLESRLFLAADPVIFSPVASFRVHPSGSQPQGLVIDSVGNLYGITATGGAKNYGTIFKIAASSHTFTTLASFTGLGDNGITPSGNLYLDSSGHLFGATIGGGTFKKGTIFEFDLNATTSTITTLASFNGTNGSYPLAGLVADASGNLYGTTKGVNLRGYASTVWELPAGSHTITTLATFKATDLLSGELATTPDGLLATDADGHIFGTTRNGGTKKLGSIFQVNSDHSVTTLASFTATLGSHPTASLIRQSDGTFIGTALTGGRYGYGTLFQLSTANTLSVLGAFNNRNGSRPLGKLVVDADGNIFGVTASGGSKGYGTVFERAAGTDNTITTVYSLARQRDGLHPTTLVVDSAGDIYVSTYAGGTYNAGAVFELSDTPVVFASPPTPPDVTPTLRLSIVQQPTTPLAAHQTFSLQVQVLDAQDNLAIVNGTATLSLNSCPPGATLAGTQTVNIVNGIATFSDLSLTLPGLYTLQVSASPLTSVLTPTITVLDPNDLPR